MWGCSDDKTGGTVPPDPDPEPEVPTLATSLAFGVPSVEFPSGGKTVDVAVVAEGGEWAVAETPRLAGCDAWRGEGDPGCRRQPERLPA